MPYRPIFIISETERKGNAQVFETETEARDSALARFRVWMVPIGIDTEKTEDAITYKRIDGRDISIC